MRIKTMSSRALKKPVVFLMGATACGKTVVSIALAQMLDAEIISVDSALVYRGLDIGTAKPTEAERKGVMHHLIDICDPWQPYSAARFCKEAHRLIQEIQERGKQVLLVGGTMLYFKALEEGLAPLPQADEGIRQALMAEAEVSGWALLHQQLARVDPCAAERIHPNDPQRILRALEVYRLSGFPLSTLQAKTSSFLESSPIKFALVPRDRVWLHARIEKRFQEMLSHDFLGEVQVLMNNPKILAEQPAMRSVGYRQAWEFLSHDKPDTQSGIWVEKAIAATRQLAKRQMTWLRGMSNVHMLDCDTLSIDEQVSAILIEVDKCLSENCGASTR